jgi:DNA polymerase I-like protein with 3'-5' exonuclease and polymerase domains
MIELKLPNIRKLFIPDHGMTFFDIDLDSADLRIVVWESDCVEMKAMFAEGKKPYVEVAKEYYRDPTITKHHPSYKIFKSLCHGTNYLGSARGIAPRVGLIVSEVERIQEWYFGKFPEIKQWQDDIIKQINTRRYITNPFGYRVHAIDRVDANLYRAFVAWKPQSTVACLINRGYLNIFRNLREVQVLLQVHDSLAGQFPTYLTDWATKRIVEECSVPIPYSDPLIIPVGIKTSPNSWGHCG